MQQLKELYRQWAGHEPQTIDRMPGAGSNRAYYRLTDEHGQSVVGVVGTSHEENHAFVTIARHFRSKQLPVPEVFAVSDDEMCYLQEDLGGTSLFDTLKPGRSKGGQYSTEETRLLEQTIRLLPRLQVVGGEGLDYSVCYPQPAFDETGIMFDLNYFKYCFLKPSGADFHELRLEEDFHRLAHDLATIQTGNTFLYRDFQARNVMLCHTPQHPTPNTQRPQCPTVLPSEPDTQHPAFIDFQGGRRGPYYYDVASFLWQASARYNDTLRSHLIDIYYDELSRYTTVPPRKCFDETLRLFVFFRTLQVLGAYGYRGYFERKKHFIDSIPQALDNLRVLLRQGVCNDYPHLAETLSALLTALTTVPKKPEKSESPEHSVPSLVVRIFSFSYKKGIPADDSGNGGGYVFDCRWTHNPGRYEPYKKLTGLDEPVIRFLEDDGEITQFLENVYRLADHHVERYIERGFTSLMFSFGCTGGQHRSVYSAQHLAEHLYNKYGVEVHLCHREQGIKQHFH